MWQPFEDPLCRPLPGIGDGIERAQLDLKATWSPTPSFEKAKDVASFANHLGGTLLIGAEEEAGRVGAYNPLAAGLVSQIWDGVSKSVAERCRPHPRIDQARYPTDTGIVLAINVWPFVGGLVGVRVSRVGGEGGGNAFAFPVRSGTDATYLLPDQFAMFLSPDARKTYILLSGIKQGEQVLVQGEIDGVAEWGDEYVFEKADLLDNALVIRNGIFLVSMPLDAVVACWRDAGGVQIAIAGGIETMEDSSLQWFRSSETRRGRRRR